LSDVNSGKRVPNCETSLHDVPEKPPVRTSLFTSESPPLRACDEIIIFKFRTQSCTRMQSIRRTDTSAEHKDTGHEQTKCGWSRTSPACSRANKHALSCTLSFDLLDRSEDGMERDAHRQRQNFKERCRFDEIANLLLCGMIAPPEVVPRRVLIDQVDLCRTSPTQTFSVVIAVMYCEYYL
jgi:hypothetical protein